MQTFISRRNPLNCLMDFGFIQSIYIETEAMLVYVKKLCDVWYDSKNRQELII